MQTEKLPKWAKVTGVLFGLTLMFIGGRFLLAPEVAEHGYGLVYHQPNYAFHFIKGVRDLFAGLLLLIFTLADWRRPVATVALVGSLIPTADMLIVLTTVGSVPGAEWIHGTTAVALWIFCFLLFRQTSTAKTSRS